MIENEQLKFYIYDVEGNYYLPCSEMVLCSDTQYCGPTN